MGNRGEPVEPNFEILGKPHANGVIRKDRITHSEEQNSHGFGTCIVVGAQSLAGSHPKFHFGNTAGLAAAFEGPVKFAAFVDKHLERHLAGKAVRGAAVARIKGPEGHFYHVEDALVWLFSRLDEILGRLFGNHVDGRVIVGGPDD
jgi:hypothetical protein